MALLELARPQLEVLRLDQSMKKDQRDRPVSLDNLDTQTFNTIKNLIVENGNWSQVLDNLPQVLNKKLLIPARSRSNLAADPSQLLGWLAPRDVTKNDLLHSFESIQFEAGMYALGKPETDIEIVTELPQYVKVQNGQTIDLKIQAKCFPNPTYEFFFKNSKVGNEPTLKISSARYSHSGSYCCRIEQRRLNGIVNEVKQYCFVEVDLDEENEKLVVNVEPPLIGLKIGTKEVKMYAITNEMDLSKLKYQWFRIDQITNSIEAIPISKNPSARSNELVIRNFQLTDAGTYKCQVTRESTDQVVLSSSDCKLVCKTPLEYDLKIALLIGNGNYHENRCERCNQELKISGKLNVYEGFERLKVKLEQSNYIVMAFVDLSAEEYLRVLCLFHDLCDGAKNVSLFVYVVGHGFHLDNMDFLIPIDIMTKFHSSDHDLRSLSSQLSLCSLSNLLDKFKTDEEQKFNVACFWDLCRSRCYNLEVEPMNSDAVNYSIVYSGSVGRRAYEIMHDNEYYGMFKGSIVLNMLIRYFKFNQSLYEIVFNMNREIQKLSAYDKKLKNLSGLRFHSTLTQTDFGTLPFKNTHFKTQIDERLKLDSVDQIFKNLTNSNNEVMFRYRYLPDIFINTINLEVEQITDKNLSIQAVFHFPLFLDETTNLNNQVRMIYRLKSFLHCREEGNNQPIKLVVTDTLTDEVEEFELEFPTYFDTIYDSLHEPYINIYLEEKKNPNLVETMSLSSVEAHYDSDNYEEEFDFNSKSR